MFACSLKKSGDSAHENAMHLPLSSLTSNGKIVELAAIEVATPQDQYFAVEYSMDDSQSDVLSRGRIGA